MMKIMLFFMLVLSYTVTTSGQKTEEKNLTNNTADDRYGNYSPDGKQIIFESNRDGNWEIYLMDADGTNQQRLTSHDSDDRRPDWHPNGMQIIFESNRSGQFGLYELVVEDRKIRKIELPSLNGEPIFARYAPDGKHIAFSDAKSDQESRIIVINSDDKTEKVVADYGFRSFYPQWSPDGKTLLFFSRHETKNEDDEIYKINIHTNSIKRLTNWPKHNFCPAWSNDGTRIAYVTSMKESRPEIYLMDADGENQMRITYNNDGDTLPDWSVDDKKLLITAYRNGNYEICELALSLK